MDNANQSFVQGSFEWTGFDYRGEETPSSWPAINSHYGLLDLAGYMKDDAYYYQAWYPILFVVHVTNKSMVCRLDFRAKSLQLREHIVKRSVPRFSWPSFFGICFAGDA